MTPGQIYDEWLSSIDLQTLRITKPPLLIFLCGGQISNKTGKFEHCREIFSHQFKSCRDIFYSHLKNCNCSFKDRVLLAEKTFDYYEHSDFDDLLSFETYLAEFSSLIIIFSESPGSIAEFGSFSTLEKVKEKLLVVINRKHYESSSFIRRGPADHLTKLAQKNDHDDPIIVYQWKNIVPDDGYLSYHDFEDASDLEELVESIISNSPKSEKFSEDRLGHKMILMLELLKVAGIAKLNEIGFFLNKLGLNLEISDIKKCLSIMESLGFLKKVKYRNNFFYHPIVEAPWVSWAYKKTSKTNDTLRWTHLLKENYSENEPLKENAIKRYQEVTAE